MSLIITRPAIPVPLTLARGGTEATTPAGARTKLQLGDLALLTAPGGTTTFLRADKTWAVPAGGGGGGDVNSNTATSVESELALFSGTTGKLIKRGTGSGLALLTNGVLSIKAAPTGAVVGTTDTQTLTGKTIAGASNTLTVREADLALSDLTTADVSLTAHGLTPKAPGGITLFLRGDATWAVPAGGGGGAPTDAEYITSTLNGTLSAERVLTDTATITWDRATSGQIKANAIGGGGYTDEQAQDAVGAMLLATTTIDLTYADATPALSATVNDASITEAKLSLSDVTTRDASTTAHGFLRKLSGTAAHYLDGSGAWTTPAGGADSYWSRTDGGSAMPAPFTAFWKMDEASGPRVDSVASLALTPVGGANLTQVAGKIGNAVGMNGTAGTYLTMANTAAVQMNTSTSVIVMCWVYLTALTDCAYVNKGNAGANAQYEYSLQMSSSKFRFALANGTTFQNLDDPGPSPTLNTWYCLIAWYDAGANTINLQINNGTVISATATTTSFASTHALELGRWAGYTGLGTLNGRIELVGIGKRVLTSLERSQLWNGGAGLDHPFAVSADSYLRPLSTADNLLLGATRLTSERLEVDGAIKLGTAVGTTDGTLRWSGTDFEGRKAGAWVSMTAGGGGQPLDATLTALAGLATGADQLPYATGTDAFAQTPLTAFARTLLDDTTQAAMRTTLALTPGTDVQAQDAELQAIAGLTSAADRVPYFTGAGTAALATFTAAGRTLAGAVDAAAQRTALGLGTLAQQDADAVAITDGQISLGGHTPTGVLDVQGSVVASDQPNQYNNVRVWPVVPSGATIIRGINIEAATGTGLAGAGFRGINITEQPAMGSAYALNLNISSGTNRYNVYAPGSADNAFGGKVGIGNLTPTYLLDVTGDARVQGKTGLGGFVLNDSRLELNYAKASVNALSIHPTDNDTASGLAVRFVSVGGVTIGSITTNASATAYNTSSDVRLKHAITPLAGALDTVRRLRPITHLWNDDDSRGYGFLAHELQQVVPDAVSGEPDAVNEDGSIRPQQVDHSRLVVWLVSAVQELAARVVSLEQQLGI